MSMADRDGWIWYDGKMVPWRDAVAALWSAVFGAPWASF